MREDVQCLRGIAILLVLLYHLFPNVFVNGYIGVDIFFVISGYLMASTISKSFSKSSKIEVFAEFYYRRFKRILPMYYLVLFGTLLLVHLYLGSFWWPANQRYALSSLLLVTNQLVIHDQTDYFKEIEVSSTSMNCFLHLWSLSVEIQFYLLVPFIFFGLQHLKNHTYRLITVMIISILGFISFIMIIPTFAFNFMFLRLWQFSAGFIAVYWKLWNVNSDKKSELKEASNSEATVIASLLSIGSCLLPTVLQPTVIRPFITISTTLILINHSQNNIILNSSLLSYVGDISYVMYLVHWPIITIFIGSTIKSYVFCISITLLISSFLHHFFEKSYLKLHSKPVIFSLILGLFITNGLLQYSTRQHLDIWTPRLTDDLQAIVDKNQFPSIFDLSLRKEKCVENQIPDVVKRDFFGYCKFPNGHGNLSVMMIGNSYVMNFVEPIRSHYDRNYSEFRYYSIGESYGIYGDSTYSNQALEISRKYVEMHRPDVLFILPRYSHELTNSIKVGDVQLEIQENVDFYSKFCKKIYILNYLPFYPTNMINMFLHYAIQKPDELETLHMKKMEVSKRMKIASHRWASLNCTKCHIFDLSEKLLENDKYLAFDRDEMLALVDNSLHFPPPALQRFDPIFKDIVEKSLL